MLEGDCELTSAQGRDVLEQVRACCAKRSSLSIADQRRLQSRFPSDLVALAHDVVQLRGKAARKFDRADQMFFTARGLEQSSDQAIGAYKSSRFPKGQPLADLCCGVGGDLIPLARMGPAVGVERDRRLAEFAKANLSANSVEGEVLLGDATAFDVSRVAAWHIDPDRRPAGRRTTQVDSFSPTWTEIGNLLELNPNAALKLAPASRFPELVGVRHVREWIGNARECRQQVLWCGDLADRDLAEGDSSDRIHRATLAEANSEPQTIEGSADVDPAIRSSLGRFIYDPHSVVLASHLLGEFALATGLAAIAPGAVYLTGDDPISSPFAQGFEILEHAPFDRKRWRAILREREIGRLDIKKRGVDIDPEPVRRQMKLKGDHKGVLIIIRQDEQVQGVLAEPLAH